jgi:thiol-disulfide isomerase/thioredoxin
MGVWARCGVVVFALAALCLPVRADDPEPAAIMRGAHEAVSKLESLAFNGRVRGIGGKATRSPSVDAMVRVVRTKNDPLGWKFVTDGTARSAGQQQRKLLTTYDGTVIRTLREADRQIVEAPASSADETMNDGAGWVLAWLIRWPDMVHKPFGGDEASAPSRYEGKMEIDGEPCHVIYVDYSEMADPTLFDAWWYISEKDSLPRRLDMHFIEGTDGFTTLTISSLEPGATLDEGALALATPEGYTVVKAKEEEKKVGGRAVVVSGVPVGEIAPDWELTDTEGKTHKLSDYRGKIVIMDFWATWCPPCREAMPGVQKLHDKYKDRGVMVFGMNSWESGDPAGYMKEKGFTYTTLLKADGVAQAYQVSGIPTFYVVGPDGKVIFSFIGFDPELDAKIGELIDRTTQP